jgi:ubiquinone/menaquinone biosynthesis C-methylase UbiE
MVRPVDYDVVAATFASRYERNDYRGVEAALAQFLGDAGVGAVVEVGCGTGHWLALAGKYGACVAGIDPSSGMLDRARQAAPGARLVRARAEALPFRPQTFDRLFCVNVLHHVADPAAFMSEAARVLRSGAGLLTIGLDPHTGRDRWWIYDYFPEALAADRERYLSTQAIRQLMSASGLDRCETREAQHLPRTLDVDEAERQGFLSRTGTSQLMVIADDLYAAGLARLRADAARSPDMRLSADLRLFATVGWRA